jgi:hypothetical protein
VFWIRNTIKTLMVAVVRITSRTSVAMMLRRFVNHRAEGGSIENLVADAEEEQQNDQAQRDSEQPQKDQ